MTKQNKTKQGLNSIQPVNLIGSCAICGKLINDYDNYKTFELGYICSEMCSKIYNRKNEPINALKSFGIGKRYLNIKNVILTKQQKKIFKKDENFEENIFITGGVGTGKTLLSIYYIYKNMYNIKLKNIKFINVTKLLSTIRDCIAKGKESEMISQYVNIDLLVLDDLGAEKITDYSLQLLYIIINERYFAMKQTVVTSNLDSNSITEYYGGRMLSRLGSGQIIKLNGIDRRL